MNHRSHLDGFIGGSAVVVPRGPRTRVALMGAGDIMQENWLYRQLHYLGAFPIFRNKPDVALDFAVEHLKKGICMVIAPQGKRIIKTPYQDYFDLAKEGKTGVGRMILALNGKVPVIPIYIHGAAEALSKGKIIPRFRSFISVSFGPPIYWHEYTRKNGWKRTDPDFYLTARKIVDKIMVKIRNLMIVQEEPLFNILEDKYGTTIDKISIPANKQRKFNKLIFKLARFPPEYLQNLIDSDFD
jgi:long-chain acyl-CoA synthetase